MNRIVFLFSFQLFTFQTCFTFLVFYCFFRSLLEKCVGLIQKNDVQFSEELHILKSPKHNLTLFTKYLSVNVSVCMQHKFCEGSISKTNALKS